MYRIAAKQQKCECVESAEREIGSQKIGSQRNIFRFIFEKSYDNPKKNGHRQIRETPTGPIPGIFVKYEQANKKQKKHRRPQKAALEDKKHKEYLYMYQQYTPFQAFIQ
jgi:hypothetical protein